MAVRCIRSHRNLSGRLSSGVLFRILTLSMVLNTPNLFHLCRTLGSLELRSAPVGRYRFLLGTIRCATPPGHGKPFAADAQTFYKYVDPPNGSTESSEDLAH